MFNDFNDSMIAPPSTKLEAKPDPPVEPLLNLQLLLVQKFARSLLEDPEKSQDVPPVLQGVRHFAADDEDRQQHERVPDELVHVLHVERQVQDLRQVEGTHAEHHETREEAIPQQFQGHGRGPVARLPESENSQNAKLQIQVRHAWIVLKRFFHGLDRNRETGEFCRWRCVESPIRMEYILEISLASEESPLYQRSSSPDKLRTTSVLCRICHEDGRLEELIEPCDCTGTLGLIHCSCLEKWLSTSNTDRCEICKYTFFVQRRNKPLAQSFCQWWKSESDYRPRGIVGDIVCFLVLTPLCAVAVYLCGLGAATYIRSGFWKGTGLTVLCCTLLATYSFWIFVTIRFHYTSWMHWSCKNQDVKLLLKHKTRNLMRVRSDNLHPKFLERNNNGRSRSDSFASWVITSDSYYDVAYSIQRATIV